MPLEYINLKYKPQADDLIAEYYLEPDGISIEQACEHLAAESSIGTWTDISTMSPKIARRLKPNVYSINHKTGEVKIAYTADLFEPGNMAQIWSAIAGNIFGMKAIKNLRLQDIRFPKSIVKSFRGPRHGIEGIKNLTKVYNRPLVGTIVKPKVGLNEEEHAKVAYEAWVGGLDVVKDDENLTSMPFNNFQKRIVKTLALRDMAERVTGEKKIYMPNITAETGEMLKRADFVKARGGEYIMVDILTCGWSGLQTVREHGEKSGMIIHAHRAMHAALTRNPNHGISMMAIAKSARLIGVDQLHIGTAAVGKMHGGRSEELALEEEMEYMRMNDDFHHNILRQDWFGIKPVLAVASGGLSPLSTPKLLKIMGKNIVAQYGGGCHGHPDGTRAGAMAIRQSLDAALKGISLKAYAETHKELQRALNKWS